LGVVLAPSESARVNASSRNGMLFSEGTAKQPEPRWEGADLC